GLDLASGFQRPRLLLDAVDCDALAAQICAQRGFIGREALSRDPVALLVHAAPAERLIALDCLSAGGCGCCCPVDFPRYSMVTLLTSSMLVTPALTFSRPERRRSQTPSLAAWSAMLMALPPSMMMRPMDSVTGMTW